MIGFWRFFCKNVILHPGLIEKQFIHQKTSLKDLISVIETPFPSGMFWFFRFRGKLFYFPTAPFGNKVFFIAIVLFYFQVDAHGDLARDSGQLKLTSFFSESLRILAERLSQSEIELPLRQISYCSPLIEVGVFFDWDKKTTFVRNFP